MEIAIIVIIISVFTGIVSAVIAKDRNRDQGGWFILGFIFNLFGMIAIALLPKIEKPDIQTTQRKITEEDIEKMKALKNRLNNRKKYMFIIITIILIVFIIGLITMNN